MHRRSWFLLVITVMALAMPPTQVNAQAAVLTVTDEWVPLAPDPVQVMDEHTFALALDHVNYGSLPRADPVTLTEDAKIKIKASLIAALDDTVSSRTADRS